MSSFNWPPLPDGGPPGPQGPAGPAGGFVYSGATNLFDDYLGDVWVDGDATVTAALHVIGDLFVTGQLINAGGFAVTVDGTVTVGTGINFTKSSGGAQALFIVQGDLVFGDGSVSEFKVNKGQSPYIWVFGDIRCGDSSTLDGTGKAEAPGLSLYVYGDIHGSFTVDLSGGDSAGVANAGDGGTVYSLGCIYTAAITAKGGNSTFAGFNAGNGGPVTALQFLRSATIDVSGGTSSDDQGGQGGAIELSGTSGPFTLSAAGGDGATGGDGGSLAFLSDGLLTSLTANLNGGAGAVAGGGNAGTITAQGSLTVASATINLNGGNGATTAGNGGDIVVRGEFLYYSSTINQAKGTGTGGSAGSTTASGWAEATVFKTDAYHLEPAERDGGNLGATEAMDLSAHNVFTGTLDQNCTITFSNPTPGGAYFLRLTQGAGGSKLVTWAGVTILWAGGDSTLSTAAGAIDCISMVYDGALGKMLASLNKAFA